MRDWKAHIKFNGLMLDRLHTIVITTLMKHFKSQKFHYCPMMTKELAQKVIGN